MMWADFFYVEHDAACDLNSSVALVLTEEWNLLVTINPILTSYITHIVDYCFKIIKS